MATAIILRLGRLAELAKLDVASAYRIVPLHLEDQPLIGMKWRGDVFVDTALPFGLRLASKVFTVLADGLEWVLRARGSCDAIHYLDDFLFIGAHRLGDCQRSMQLAKRAYNRLGVPLAGEKSEGPAHQLGVPGYRGGLCESGTAPARGETAAFR